MFLLQIYLLAVLVIPATANKEPIELARTEAREKFYQCIENEKEISAAIRLFKQISQTNGKYEGIWKYGERNGYGKSVWSEPHQEHEGEYKNGKKNGFGTEIYEDGSKYVGNFTNHERDGQGTYYYTNGDKYVGEWKKSSVHGKGTWFLNNGDRWVGELRNDKDWNTTGYDKNGNIIGRIGPLLYERNSYDLRQENYVSDVKIQILKLQLLLQSFHHGKTYHLSR